MDLTAGTAIRGEQQVARHWLGGVWMDILLVILLVLPVLLPLAATGYLHGHDSNDPPWRALELARSLEEGVLFPRWSGDLYYRFGWPLFNFQSPLSAYPAALMATITPIGYVEASKLSFALFFAMAGIGSYLLARKVLNHRGARLLAVALFLYSPATVGDLYTRSSLASLAGTCALSFALFAFVSALDRPSLFWIGAAGLTLSATILTHNAVAVAGLGMMGVYGVCQFWQTRNANIIAIAVGILALGMGVSAFFLVPSMAEVRFTHLAEVSSGQIWEQFTNPLGNVFETSAATRYSQTNWGPFDLHPAYPYGELPFKLGLLDGLLLIGVGVVLAGSKRRSPVVVSLYAGSLLLYFLSTSWSRWLWEAVPSGEYMQFPWRLTRPMQLSLAVAASWAIVQVCQSRFRLVAVSLGVAAFLSSMWLAPSDMRPVEWNYPVDADGLLRWESQEPGEAGTDDRLLPASVQWEGFGANKLPARYGQSFPDERWVDWTAFLPDGSRAWVLATRRGQQWLEARIEAAETTRVTFRALHFPGWTAYLDGEVVPVLPSPRQEYEEGRWATLGLSQIEVPAGTHHVRLAFEDTDLRRWSNSLSALSAVVVFGLLLAGAWRGTTGRRAGLVVVLALGLVAAGAAGASALQASAAYARTPWIENRVVSDLLVEAQERRLDVRVAPPGKAEDYVHVRQFDLQGHDGPVIYMHPSASVATSVWIPGRATLKFAMGIDPAVWDKPGDGVDFEVAVREGQELTTIFRRYVDPKSDPGDRGWVQGSVDLNRFAHRTVDIVLSTAPGLSGDFDWAGWASPRIVLP